MFDFQKTPAIGFVSDIKGTDNALLEVCAVIESDGTITRATETDFQPSLNVFAPSFYIKTQVDYRLKNSKSGKIFFSFYCELNQDLRQLTKYVIDYSRDIEICSLVIMADWFKNEGALFFNNHFISEVNNLIAPFNTFYPFDRKNNLFFTEVKINDDICTPSQNKHIDGFRAESNCKYLYQIDNSRLWVSSKKGIANLFSRECVTKQDLMTDPQLCDWIKKTINDYSRIDDINTKRLITNTLSKLATSQLGNHERQRYNRAMNLISGSLTFSDKEIVDLVNSNSIVGNELKKKINDLKDKLLPDIVKEKQEIEAQISTLKNEKLAALEKEIQELSAAEYAKLDVAFKREKDSKQKQLDSLSETIAMQDKTKTANEALLKEYEENIKVVAQAEEKKKQLLEDLNILQTMIDALKKTKEALAKAPSSEQEGLSIDSYTIPQNPNAKNIADVEDPEDYDRFIPSIQGWDRAILAKIRYYKASIVPSIAWSYVFAYYSQNCIVVTLSIEHDWLKKDIIYSKGLLAVWNNAWIHPEWNYLLVLQNMNIIPSHCGLQVLFDVISNKRLSLPKSTKPGFPPNLRIVGTLLPSQEEGSIGLKIKKDDFKGWAFLGTPKEANCGIPDKLDKQKYFLPLTKCVFKPVSDTENFDAYAEY